MSCINLFIHHYFVLFQLFDFENERILSMTTVDYFVFVMMKHITITVKEKGKGPTY